MWPVHSRSVWLEALSRHAAERPTAVAVAEVAADGGAVRTATYRELVAGAAARAGAISGVVRPGATMLAAWPSGIDLAAWFAGAISAGVRLVLMHPKCGAGECAAVCGRAHVKAVLATEPLLTRIRDPIVRLEGLFHAALKREGSGREHVRLRGECAPGGIVLGSSGTTGLPKLVLRESAALDADARAVGVGMSLTADDCVLCVPPLCHSYGADVLLGTLLAGATLRVMTEFDPAGVVRQLADGVTVLPGVPFMYESLARIGGGAGEGTDGPGPAHALRLALSAGSPLNTRVRREFASRWKIEVGQLYGATELGTVSMSIPGEPGFDADSVGRPLPGVSFRVVDVDDPTRVLSPGEEGQLAVMAPSMLSGYIDDEVALVNGHLLTGDLARMDNEGRATITGRLKLLIDTGGFKVNPLEVEARLLEHPGVAECAVVPLELSDTIQRPFALVVARDSQRPPGDAELRQFLRERLAPTKIPRSFRMVASLPRSPLGKLLRDRLPKGDA